MRPGAIRVFFSYKNDENQNVKIRYVILQLFPKHARRFLSKNLSKILGNIRFYNATYWEIILFESLRSHCTDHAFA